MKETLNSKQTSSGIEIIDEIDLTEENGPSESNCVSEQQNEGLYDLEIIFRDSNCAEKYSADIESFLKKLLTNYETFKIKCLHKSNINGDAANVSNCLSTNISSPTKTRPASPNSFVYSSPFDNPVGVEENVTENKEKKRKPAVVCFNCLGEHHLKDCPQELNSFQIANNKKDYFEAAASTPLSLSRYHGDEPTSDKFRPGVLSPALREALNLFPDQLPPYIYTMRILGYPPGWMEEARVRTSGISVFDSERNETSNYVNNSDENQFDGKRFNEYPGFNSPVPDGVFDEFRELGMPPLLQHQLLSEAMKHTLVNPNISTAYKKKKLGEENNNNNRKKVKTDNNNDHSDEGLITDDSSTDVDLNEEYKQSSDESSAKCELTNEIKIEFNNESPSVSRDFGIPLIDTPNSDKSLPSYDKFSSGIADHENFENLPESVGAYDSMRDLIGDVRQRLFDKND